MTKLKIVIISDWFSENMGYVENFLPKALADLGHDIHLITSTAQVYYNSPDYNKTYRPFLGKNIVESGVRKMGKYTLHRLPLRANAVGMPSIKGLKNYLKKLEPQIIQTFSINSLSTYEAAEYCSSTNCKLFTESHIHASVFRKKNIFRKNILKILFQNNILKIIFEIFRSRLGKNQLKFINNITQICYPIAPDAAKIANKYFNVSEEKIKVQSLGVDTSLFNPPNEQFLKIQYGKLRARLGIKNNSLVCIYTGRFAKDKKPQCLARAINYLQEKNENIQGLFIGNGTAEEIAEINRMKGCIIHKFVQVEELPKFYWISDIGVWPSQESTSQLDAAACGLPLILSNKIEVNERIDGNGLLYEEDNEGSLAEQIQLLKNLQLRKKMSQIGAKKIKDKFSWISIAQTRTEDYIKSL